MPYKDKEKRNEWKRKYYETHKNDETFKEKKKQYEKNYYEKHYDEISKHKAEYIECECGSKLQRQCIPRHRQNNFHKYNLIEKYFKALPFYETSF
jgi:hypothetical protein